MIINEPENAKAIIVLAHGAGAPMDSDVMTAISRALVSHNIKVVRFEFDYMAQRRTGGSKRPPPRMPILVNEFKQICLHILAREQLPVFIGGKSMGGRVASLLAASEMLPSAIAGVVCLGYPFHPPKKTEKTRIDHLPEITKPIVIIQGTRDPLGTFDEVQGYGLPSAIQLSWLTSANHDFKPLKSSGLTQQQCIAQAAECVSAFIGSKV